MSANLDTETLFTIGHGDRTLDGLLEVLTSQGITTLVDIRSRPVSARFPHFNEDHLRAGVEQVGGTYHWAGRQLGGLRAIPGHGVHPALEPGLRGFAEYMGSTGFERAASGLRRLASSERTAILCAELQPAHCHRRLIADYLILEGVRVVHLISALETREHVLSDEARRESARLVYDRNASGGSGV